MLARIESPMAPEKQSRRSATLLRHDSLELALVDAAEMVIAADGLFALRARALAEQVGCSVGAIYSVFPDLDAVILAVNARTLAHIDVAMTDAGLVADPVAHLVHLATTYLDYAAGARQRWAALFLHTIGGGRKAPDWYARRQAAAFSHIEAPLGRLCPELPPARRALLARALFSAVHGMVALGLDEKVAAMSLPTLRQQVATIVTATARGLAHGER